LRYSKKYLRFLRNGLRLEQKNELGATETKMFIADQKIDGRTSAKKAKPSSFEMNWLKCLFRKKIHSIKRWRIFRSALWG